MTGIPTITGKRFQLLPTWCVDPWSYDPENQTGTSAIIERIYLI
jgi:hypothetical protein